MTRSGESLWKSIGTIFQLKIASSLKRAQKAVFPAMRFSSVGSDTAPINWMNQRKPLLSFDSFLNTMTRSITS